VKMMDRARALFGRAKKAPELSRSVVEHEAIDDYVFSELNQTAMRFHEAVNRKPEVGFNDEGEPIVCDNAPDLWRDVFNTFHTQAHEVRLRDRAQVRPSNQLFHEIMEHFVEEEDTRKARTLSRGDRTIAGLTTMRSCEVLEEALKEQLSEHVERSEQMREQEQAMALNEAALEQLRQEAREQKAQQGAVEQATADAIAQAAQAKRDARQQLEQLIDEQDGSGMGVAAAQAVREAAQEAADMANVWSSLPGNEPGRPSNVAPDVALDLAMKWRDSEKMTKAALMAGRMRRSAKAARRRNIKGGREERIGVERGNDLSLALPSDLTRLAHPVLKYVWARDYVMRQLPQYETQGTEEAGRGPLVILRDVSGSMGMGTGGQQGYDVWATAVCLSLLALAQRDNRAVCIVDYEAKLWTTWEFGRKPDLVKLTEMAGVASTGGGTDGTLALHEAERIILRAPAFKKADVVLITDGADNLSDRSYAVRDRLRTKGVRIQGVSIGRALASNRFVSELSDDAFAVTDLSGPSDVTDALALGTI
jgi:uncharacterized protein with von Willebrand factor type A (vWA) domain